MLHALVLCVVDVRVCVTGHAGGAGHRQLGTIGNCYSRLVMLLQGHIQQYFVKALRGQAAVDQASLQ